MPEGPSIIILKEAVQAFSGKKIISVDGNSKLNIQRLSGQKIIEFKSWGKHFLICFKKLTVKIHLMLFGSYTINEKRKERFPRLSLHFKNGDIYFYACSIQFIEDDLNALYDWSGDVMNDKWSPAKARQN
ncbi:MAG: DNA-formamidopyrimidine glycosylase family protein [Ginsengibacter sp.]